MILFPSLSNIQKKMNLYVHRQYTCQLVSSDQMKGMFQNQNEIFYIFWQHFLVVLCLAISINMSLLLCSFKDIAPAPHPWKPDPVSRLTPSCTVSQFNILSYSVASNIATSNLFVRGMKYHTCRILRVGICECRHCRRQCKIFASGVNFSIFIFLCFYH